MTRRRKNTEYVPPIPDEELAWRMSSSAGRKLEERLEAVGWTEDAHPLETDGA